MASIDHERIIQGMAMLVMPDNSTQNEPAQQAGTPRPNQVGITHAAFLAGQNTPETHSAEPLSLAQFLDSVERIMAQQDEWVTRDGLSQE